MERISCGLSNSKVEKDNVTFLVWYGPQNEYWSGHSKVPSPAQFTTEVIHNSQICFVFWCHFRHADVGGVWFALMLLTRPEKYNCNWELRRSRRDVIEEYEQIASRARRGRWPCHVRIQEPRGLEWAERGDATVIYAKIQKGWTADRHQKRKAVHSLPWLHYYRFYRVLLYKAVYLIIGDVGRCWSK